MVLTIKNVKKKTFTYDFTNKSKCNPIIFNIFARRN